MFKLTVPLVLQVLKKRKVDDAQRKERAAARKERKVRVDARNLNSRQCYFDLDTLSLFSGQHRQPQRIKPAACLMLRTSMSPRVLRYCVAGFFDFSPEVYGTGGRRGVAVRSLFILLLYFEVAALE